MSESSPSPRAPRLLSRLLVGAWVGYWVLLFTMMHLPRPPGAKVVAKLGDKVVHASAYFVLAALGGLVWRRLGRVTGGRWLATWLGIYCGYAVADESLQMLVPGRSAQLTDWAADVIGAAGGLFLVVVLTGAVRRRPDLER